MRTEAEEKGPVKERIKVYIEASVKNLQLNKALAGMSGTVAPSEGTLREIRNLKDKVDTELSTGQVEKAYNIVNKYLENKNKNPEVAAVFKGVRMALYTEMKVNHQQKYQSLDGFNHNSKLDRIDNSFDDLQNAVGKFRGEVNKTLNSAKTDSGHKEVVENQKFLQAQGDKVSRLCDKAKRIIEQHREFGTDASLDQAKKELKQEFNKYQRGVKVESFFNAIKEALEKVVSTITKIGLPPMAQKAIVHRSTTLANLQADVKLTAPSFGSSKR